MTIRRRKLILLNAVDSNILKPKIEWDLVIHINSISLSNLKKILNFSYFSQFIMHFHLKKFASY